MELSLRLRTYPNELFASLWLLADSACLLWGELRPDLAEEIIAALGLPVERSEGEAFGQVLTPPECASLKRQGELFQ